MKYFILSALFFSLVAHADVYRSVDQYGNTVYSDIEDETSEKVVIDIAPSYTAVAVEAELPIFEEEVAEENIIPNYKLTIVSPSQNESLHNPESIIVAVELMPELNALRNDKLLFKLDGKEVTAASTSLNTVLTGVERGSHILLVSVVDKKGKVLKKSKSTLFHVHRTSVAP
ncbi:MAG: hypothetical protein COA90_03570 [Gammaproteobacteria bacterium]|nr:MAG: hypothetical protein COA90_03570 [Gammaproteobacteria bacterium]